MNVICGWCLLSKYVRAIQMKSVDLRNKTDILLCAAVWRLYCVQLQAKEVISMG
jgi:hypothetical protein